MDIHTTSRPMVDGAAIYDRVGVILYLNTSYSVTMDIIGLQQSLCENIGGVAS